MKFGYNKKFRTTVITGILALSVNLGIINTANATISTASINLNNAFIHELRSGSERGYLVYSPTDRTIIGKDGWNTSVVGTLQGGKLYFVKNTDGVVDGSDSSSNTPNTFAFDSAGNLVDDSAAQRGEYSNYLILGNAQDIFGEGITEDEIKDLIANVEGDQTVDGNQTVTGSQDVQGGQHFQSRLIIQKILI